MDHPEIPSEFRQCVSSDGSEVLLAGKGLTEVPDWLRSLGGLKVLDLSNNTITEVPGWLRDLASLNSLDLSNNELTEVPDWLESKIVWENLRLAGNRLREFPGSPEGLPAPLAVNLPGSELPKTSQDPFENRPLRGDVTPSGSQEDWHGARLDRLDYRLESLFKPYISVGALVSAAESTNPGAAVLQLYTWERERLLTLAKGVGGAAVTVLAGLISAAVEEKTIRSTIALLAAALTVILLIWSGFLLTRLRRLAEEYTEVLSLVK